jgi:hypothetical protein
VIFVYTEENVMKGVEIMEVAFGEQRLGGV